MAKIWGKMKIIIPQSCQLTIIVKNIIQYLDFISEFTRYLEISNDNIEWSKLKHKIDTVKKNNEWSRPKRLTKKLLVVFVKKATL